jgi:hypothetical protein
MFQQPPGPLRVLSLHNPWACLMACGAKTIETRSWGPKIKYRGDVAIHASKGFDNEEKELCTLSPFADELVKGGWKNLRAILETCGKVLCVVELYDIVEMTHALCEEMRQRSGSGALDFRFGVWEPGRYAWMTRTVRRLDKPIELRGLQGLYTWPEGRVLCGV